MKRVAIVGYGFMGRTHYGAWRKTRGAKVVAVCDKCLAQLTRRVEGNVKGVADNSALPPSVKVYEDYDALLSAGGFDIVDITLPTLLHCETAVKAMKSGYDILCEKPMALTVADCDRMLRTMKVTGRKMLIAHVVRLQPANEWLKNAIGAKTYGNVVAADFTRFIAPPKWSTRGADWFFDEKKSGGVYLDAHIHDVDLVLSLFGKPQRIKALSHRRDTGYVDHTSALYDYRSFVVTVESSFAASQSLVFDSAFRVFFERATVFFGGRYKDEFVVYPESGKPFSPKLKDKTVAYAAETRYFLDYIEGRNDGSRLSAATARESVSLAIKERAASQQ